MVSKVIKGKGKVIAIALVVISVIATLIGINYATEDNHYVVDVIKENATASDTNMQVTEKIVKEKDAQYFDSKELNYELELKNIGQTDNVENQIAILTDFSYSMETNDTNSVTKAKAIELANGILTNIKNSRVSVSTNSSVKTSMTTDTNTIASVINGSTYGDGNDSNTGLDKAYSTFTTATNSKNTVNKYIMVFTDSTDDVSEKMQRLCEADPNLHIISILVDMTSTSYIVDNTAVCGDVYLLLSGIEEADVTSNVEILDLQKIYDAINKAVNEVVVTNQFSDEILTYFDISDLTTENGEVEQTENGYTWNVGKIKYQDTAKLKFKLTLKTNVDIDAGIIFNDIYTNKEQNISYKAQGNDVQTLQGTDGREGTEATTLKICQGYTLKVKAVNESNTDLPIEGVKFKVIGTNEDGEEVCNLIKTTDKDGYITITADDARALRGDGTINYTLTPSVNLVGYTNTDSVTFNITNNKTTRKLSYDNNESELKGEINETKRTIEVTVPINSQRIDFELRTNELNNDNVTISGAEFELIQPKLNNQYEMDVLRGTTDENGIIHFAPTVMTKDGKYNYILRQISTPDEYEVTALTLITIEYKDGIIKSTSTQFNENVKSEVCTDKENHVLVTVGNECVEESPFDLQINLSDSIDGTKLDGVTYLITTTNANNQVRKEYATTDDNGQINTKVYGTGNLNIKITEQSPKVGYKADTISKELIISRNNGIITIWNKTVGLDVSQNTEQTNMVVNLTSVKKAEQNIVKVSLVDKDEIDVGIGKDIKYTLKDTETGREYGPAVSDKNGELSFTIDTKEQGQHRYTLIVDKTTIPEEYDATQVVDELNFNLTFDESGYMIEENIIDDATVVEDYYSKVSGDKIEEYTCFIKVGYTLNLDNTIDFKIQLNEKDNTSTAIDGAKYNIDIEWDVNGVTRTKTIKERKTNASGTLITRITRADEIRIYATQVGAAPGYTCDNTTQEIYVTFNNNGDINIKQSPYDRGDTNTDEPLQGAYVSGGNAIVYQHLNRKRTSEDTYVNLTINKTDINGAYKEGVKVGIESSLLVDKEGTKYSYSNAQQIYTTDADGTIAFDYQQYLKDIQNNIESSNNIIRVPGIGTEADEIVYDLSISEMKLDDKSPSGYAVKDGTTVKLRLIFRLKDGRITLTNVETIYGNRLVKNKEFSSSSDNSAGQEEEDSLGVYLSNITLDLYTDYDDVGNLSLDLRKQNNLGNDLSGAEYDIKIVNPDSTIVRKHTKISNGEDSSDIELAGVSVNVGSLIYITETTAPIGYGVNNNTETLEVKQITDDGDVVIEQIDQAYSENRLKLEKLESTATASGTIKSNYQVTLIDYQLDTFEFGIKAVNSSSLKGIEEYGFKIESSLGAQSTLTTNTDGEGKTLIGGNIEDQTITYTVTTTKAADYYKPLKTPIKANVVFDVSGNIDTEATLNAQTDAGYGKTWTIEDIETNGKIDIKILIDHQDPLTVKVKTIDKITNANITDVQYKIEESEDIPGTGSNSIDVGYVLENGMKSYKLTQTSIKESYAKVEDKTFIVTYANENVTGATLNSSTEADTIQVTGNKEVTIKIFVEPKVPFEITNLYYFNNDTKLQGSNFEITEIDSKDVGTGTTNVDGKTGIYSGILGTDKDVMYRVRQTLAASGYATVEDFYVKVNYDANREMTSAKLVDSNGDDVSANKFITVGFTKTSTFSTYNSNNKGIVTIQVLNYPEFKMNIEDVDRRNETTKIAGTEYSVASQYTTSDDKQVDFTSTEGVLTNEDGIGVAHLDKTKENTIVTYTIKEDVPATGYQSLGTDIKVKVTFDGDGYVGNVEIENSDNLSKIATANKVETVSEPTDNFIVNVHLKNNPILKFNLTAEDSADHDTKIKDLGFTIVSKYNDEVYSNSSATNKVNQKEDPETSYTDVNGYTASYLDRTLDNQDMYYTITEVQKSAGYDWADKDIIIKVTYDSNGKIASVTPVQGGEIINIESFNTDNFEINIDIYNDEIKEFGINLTAVDTYDSNKKINNMKVNAFLTDQGNTSYTPDDKYKLLDDDALVTGADRNNDGKPDLAYGEDYKTFGKYDEGAGTRTLRLVIKNDSHQTSKKGYYLDSTDESSSGNSIGYYRGAKYYADAKYQTVEYQYLISVTFDDEGKITDAKIQSGFNTFVGWLVDGRYLEVSHTNYKLNVTMKFFPLLDLKISAMNNFTYQNEIDKDGQPIALDGSKYTVTTLRHLPATSRQRDELVDAGYIGYGVSYGEYGTLAQADYYEDTNELLVPIENNKTRLFYVFEEVEPTNYQKYTDRYLVYYIQRLTAIIQVTFDEYGEIKYDESIVRKVDDNEIKPYIAEDNTTYLSSNNIQEYNYYYDKTEANRNINFYIGYGLTTKINVTAKDDISSSPISNIRMLPCINNTYSTNLSYEYTTESYRDTSSEGKMSWKYWGAATADNVNKYIIGSTRYGSSYNGYFFPSDLASTEIGGSGNTQDYYANLDVTYGSDGKISNVKSLGTDTWGDDNTANITWDSETGNIYVDMLYSRKLQMTLNKTDYYDSTINDLDATFNVISNKGFKRSINSKQMTAIGKVYKDTTVKYTLSETQAPDEYYPIPQTIDYYITFNDKGNFATKDVKSNSDYFETKNVSENTEKVNKTTPDLTINVKNKPAFILDMQVIDKFYKNLGLSDAYLKITSDKGDVASGNPQTDERGYASVIAGPVYPNETVKYYIEQTNTINGYYPNSTKIELQVKYNDVGKIEDYKIIQGNDAINNFNSSEFMNSRKIKASIMNMPKDLKIGLYKYDKITDEPMAGVSFTITKTNINSGETSEKQIITETNGAVIETIDTFDTSTSGRTIKYTIHEDTTPESYRTMEDVVFVIKYNSDGSMDSCNQIANDNGILNEKVQLDMATNGEIKDLNNQYVHFKVTVPNDNAFDLIIKNEDINYDGLGIERSKFDVSINGKTYNPDVTNEEGTTTVADITESGEITISIAQNEAGEGYKSDIDNNIKIQLQKGVSVYSLDLDSTTAGYVDDKNATTEKAIVKVDEEYGKIEVTFKNETQTELTVLKQDINSKKGLKDTEFEVTAQQVSSDGSTTIGDEITLTTEDNKVTDQDGKLYFNLGVAPQSQIWKYTFKEVTPPEGYNPIVDLTMTVTYDQYGRIIKQESSKTSRLNAIMEDEWYNCHNMYAIIYNGDVSPAYTVKVVTEDAETGKRINGSNVGITITNADTETEDLIKVEPKTEASAKNGTITTTGNLGIDGKMYTDEEVNAEESEAPAIIEKGLAYIDNIDYEGNININVSQKETAPGYVFGEHTDGNIKIKAEYVPQLDEDPTVNFTVIEHDGFNVITDNVNRTITIKILNESRVTFDITTVEYGSEPLKGISGVNYNITAEIQTITENIETDIDETTPLSDTNGNSKAGVGTAFAGKTVVYTLKQNIKNGYNQIEDIKIEVKYDSNGYIKYYELLTSENYVNINESEEKGRTISLTVQNRKQLQGYTIYVEKHAKDTDTDEDAYGKLLPGAKYKVTVNQENSGVQYTTWTGVTDENGLIEGITLDGYGYITVTLEELSSPDGYRIDTLRKIRLYRDENTGEIEEIIGDINFEHNEDYTKVYLKPIDDQAQNKFTLVINKVSTATNKYITEDQAKFKAVLQKEDDDGNIIYQDTIENLYTDKNGKVYKDGLDLPYDAGEYKLIITEEKAPDGYKKLENPVELKVVFDTDSKEETIISTVSSESKYISTSKVTTQLIGINVGNDVDNSIKEDEYSLDITKVDSETGNAIENMAIFKVQLPDENNTSVYAETKETLLGPGKLDYCYIEQDKDYTVRLTHMKKPTEPGIYVYKFKEIVAPEGYTKIDDEFELSIEFATDEETGKIYIKDVKSNNENYLRVNTKAPYNIEEPISIDILNSEYKEEQYTIHYDANDNGEGITAPADQIKDKDVDLQLSTEELSRTGYIFKGWATLPNATTPDFKTGDTYTLNQSITLYAVWEENLYLKSTEYVISDETKYSTDATLDENQYENGDTYILGIKPKLTIEDEANANEWTKGTKLEDFINNIQTNADNVKLYDAENKEITTEDKYIGTGMTVEFIKGNQTPIRLTVIVKGDINGDGILNISDITRAKRYIKKDDKSILDTIAKQLAFDVNMDGKTNMKDANNMQRAQSNDDIRRLSN